MPNPQNVISLLLPQPESVTSLVQVVVADVFSLEDSKFNTQSANQHDYCQKQKAYQTEWPPASEEKVDVSRERTQ